MHNFFDLADFSREQVIELLTLAERLQKKPEPQALAGKILGLLFFNPSLRTLASFQAAMARLGGTSFVIAAGQGTWQLETRRGAVMNGAPAEHVREGHAVIAVTGDAERIGPVLSHFGDVVVYNPEKEFERVRTIPANPQAPVELEREGGQ